MENWKPIVGYEGLYEVSDLGRVKSVARIVHRSPTSRTVPEKMLSINIQSQGYPVVTICRTGVKKKVRVSRLVAIEFVENPFNLPEVNHEDGNKLNCAASNLSWTDRSGNMKHAYRTGLCGKPVGYTNEMRRFIK